MYSRFAILLDGAFVIKKLKVFLQRFPTVEDVVRLSNHLAARDELSGLKLLRIYYYDAPPAKGVLVNPIDKSRLDLTSSAVHTRQENLLHALELQPNIALRLGELVANNWRFGSKASDTLMKNPRMIEARDLVPNILQKGVDLRIGLDIARLSLRRQADVIVVVTGDSDLVPAFRFARREGTRVYLDHLDHSVLRPLKAHSDLTFSNTLNTIWGPLANIA